jgi:hypothetical protein
MDPFRDLRTFFSRRRRQRLAFKMVLRIPTGAKRCLPLPKKYSNEKKTSAPPAMHVWFLLSRARLALKRR